MHAICLLGPWPGVTSMHMSESQQQQKKPSIRPSTVLALGCSAFLILGVLGIFLLGVMGNSKSTSIDDSAILRLKLNGAIPEYVRETGLEDFFGENPVTVRQHVHNLEKAAVDKRIKGVLLEIEGMQAGWGKIGELRDALIEFKKSGKFVVAFSESLSEKEYALALASDEIIMPNDAWFEFNGFATDIGHMPGFLEKLGIDVQYFAYGKYKSASGEQSGRKAFTEPVKEMLNGNLDVAFNLFIDDVANFRKLDKEKVKGLIEEGRTKSNWALENKLIDALGYQDEVETNLRTRLKIEKDTKLSFVSASKYRNISGDSVGLPDGKHTFALIYSQGLIVAGQGSEGGFMGDGTQGSAPLIKSIRRAVADEDVKAIIFRVDSPGGAGLGCDYIRREIELARAKKPVIVSMSDVAASGGYWVSMDATGIVAQPGTATGSIGIYTVITSLGGFYDKLGINNETFKKGSHADALIAARKMDEGEAKTWDADLFKSYQRFVTLAAKGRGKTYEELEPLAQGRTWLGVDAIKNGLIDKLGGFPAAIELGKEKAKIPAGETVKLVLFDKQKTWFEELTNKGDEDDDMTHSLANLALKKLGEASGAQLLFKQVPGLAALTKEVLSGKHTLYPIAEYQVDMH
jgi:protease IV